MLPAVRAQRRRRRRRSQRRLIFRRLIEVSLPVDLAAVDTLYRSPTLDLRGRTLVNAFVSITVVEDNAAADVTLLRGQVELVDAGGGVRSGAPTLITSQAFGPGLVQYRGRGQHNFPLALSPDGLGVGAYWALAGATDQLPAAGFRRLLLQVDGVLVAGESTGVP